MTTGRQCLGLIGDKHLRCYPNRTYFVLCLCGDGTPSRRLGGTYMASRPRACFGLVHGLALVKMVESLVVACAVVYSVLCDKEEEKV